MSKWRRAWGECSICGRRDLAINMVLDGQFNVWVCRQDYQNRHPQEFPVDTTEVYSPNRAPEVSIPVANGTGAPPIQFDPSTGGYFYYYVPNNLLVNTADFSLWNQNQRVSVVADQIIAPDMTLTADKLVATAAAISGTPVQLISEATPVTPEEPYSFSAYLKAGSVDSAQLQLVAWNGVTEFSVVQDIFLISGPGAILQGITSGLVTGLSPSDWTKVTLALETSGADTISVRPKISPALGNPDRWFGLGGQVQPGIGDYIYGWYPVVVEGQP